jgi:hypothetical protein
MRYPSTTYSSICYRRLADIHAQKTEWLWPGWLALGKLAILEGDPGLGKSLVTLDLCARLTSGRPWPDAPASQGASSATGTCSVDSNGLSASAEGCPATPSNVVILNAEDNIEDTVRPRLQALGGNSDRVFHLDGVVDKKGEEGIRFPAHALALRDLVQQTQARLVVIDPLVSFLERSVQTHQEQSVRALLGLFKDLAEEQHCAVLLVRHLNKNDQQRALYRGTASIGFVAAVRCAWLLAADPQQPGRRVLAQLKNNLQCLAPSLSFAISGDSALSAPRLPPGPPSSPGLSSFSSGQALQLTWHGTSPHTVDQLLERRRGRGRPATRRERATENLRLFLEEAPRRAEEGQEFAEDQKISPRTLARIKEALAIRSVRAPDGDRRATFWLLPGQLPENVTEAMLTPVETREQELQAAQEDSTQFLLDLVKKHGNQPLPRAKGDQ